MLKEFKDFINRGNVIDLAVAVVIGAAFAPVITAVVERLLLPIIGLIVGTPNFDNIGTFAEGTGSVGAVITAIVNFVFVALAVFLVVKAYNSFQDRVTETPPPEVAEEVAIPEDIKLLREIRDALTNP